jgi:endonuclease/exonuclease/phosphatase family metal-dependent hydrolase
VLDLDGVGTVQFLNLHMGTSFFERRQQVNKLMMSPAISLPEPHGRRIIAGDFNEWTTGLTTRLLKARYQSVDAKLHLGRTRTFPGIIPLIHVDHIYFDTGFKLINAFVHRSRKATLASDHLPIVAEFEVN